MLFPQFLVANLHHDGLRLFGRQLLHRHNQNSVAIHGGDSIGVSILRQGELPHKLPQAALHPQVLDSFLSLPLPLPAHHQNVVVLQLHLNISGGNPGHVDDENVGVGVLPDVGRRRRHGLGVANIGFGGVVVLAGLLVLVGGIHQILEGGDGDEASVYAEISQIH